jgi:hypothetical protein
MGAGRRRLEAGPLWPSVHEMSRPTSDGCHWQVRLEKDLAGTKGGSIRRTEMT